MRRKSVLIIFLIALLIENIIANASLESYVNQKNQANFTRRENRFLSLFNIVNFPNLPCTGGSGDLGTCLTNQACSDITGASIDGNCAAGFGACCVVVVSACGSTITQNSTFITNPNFPSGFTTAGTCSYTIAQADSNVCTIRLDFDRFTITGPDLTGTPAGNCLTDSLTMTAAVGEDPPVICGENAGQHLYMNAGFQNTNSLMLSFSLTGTTFNRFWKIRVSQIPCDEIFSPPPFCQMYVTGVSNTIRTHNFIRSDGEFFHLNNQFYQVCVRQERGYCRIAWNQCADDFSFTLTNNAISKAGQALCDTDYIRIVRGQGGDFQCSVRDLSSAIATDLITVIHADRFCGQQLNCISRQTVPMPVISDSVPFGFYVHFNSQETGLPNNNRGACLDYRQLPC